MIFGINESELGHLLDKSVIPMVSSFLPEEELGGLDADAVTLILEEVENALE
jgi:hypothetical protein